MKNCIKILPLIAAALLCASCAQKAVVKCTVADSPKQEIAVARLNLNTFEILDTVKTNASGSFKYNVAVKKGDPEFVYFFRNGVKIASLIACEGDKITVCADTLGNFTVDGSEESILLQEVDKNYSDFVGKMLSTDDSKELSRTYIAYYREMVKYVMSHSHSLTVIPVLYQNLGETAYIFGNATDMIHFRSACDSLKTVYPDSRYVKALDQEAKRREQSFHINNALAQATEVGFIDIALPGLNGTNVSLAGVDAKVILVHFWNSADGAQALFNSEVLKPLYDEFHKKGLEIYAVGVDSDKAHWATVVRNQNMGWINVFDGVVTGARSLVLYNITELPSTVMIANGEIQASINGVDDLRKELKKRLK